MAGVVLRKGSFYPPGDTVQCWSAILVVTTGSGERHQHLVGRGH